MNGDEDEKRVLGFAEPTVHPSGVNPDILRGIGDCSLRILKLAAPDGRENPEAFNLYPPE